MKKAVAAAAAVLLFASLVWWAASSGALESSSGNQNASALFVAQNPGLEPPLANPVTAVREDRSPVEVSRADKFGIVTGRVVWMPERTPAVGIGIRLARQPQLLAIGPPDQVLTDDEGRFRFEHLVPGKFDVRLDRAQVKRSLDVIAGSTIDFELEVPRGRDVVGRVMDREGNPVAGAEIWMGESNSQWSREVGRSAGDGTYRIEGVDGWTSAFARLPGFAPSGAQQFVTWPREDGSPQIFDLYLGWAAGRIAGRVVDSFGNPCVDAWVEVGDVSDGGGVDPAGERMMRRKPEFVRTREDGSFEVGDLAVGPHDIHVRAPGHPALSREVIVASGLVARVEFALPRSSRVFGRVTNPSGGPVEGADVTMTNVEAGSTVKLGSDPAGRFDSGTVAAGRTRLTVKHKIGRKVELDVDLEPGSTFEWSPQLGAFAAIRARIVDAKGRPVPGVVVSCTARSKLNATSDAEGRVVFEAMPDRACMLLIVENEQVCMRQSSVRPGEPEIDCVYEVPSAYVVGRLVEADGTPGRGQFLDVDHVRAKTDDDGRFEVGPLHPGSYELRMSGQNLRRFTPRDFELHAGEVLDLGVVKCSDVGSLHVQARSSEGVPIGWVTPTVRQVDRWNGWLHKRGWNDRGEWLVDDLPAGEYELTTTGAGVATEVRRFVVESRKRTELEVDLRFGAPVRVLVHVDKSSTRLQGLTIIVRRTEGTHPLERTWDWKFAEPVGDFDFSLREGRYEITATAHDGRKGKAWVDVPRAGSPRTDVAIELR